MTLYGALVVALGLVLAFFASRREAELGGDRFAPLVLYAWHSAMVIAYWLFAQVSDLDAEAYYDLGQSIGTPSVGSGAIMWATGLMRSVAPGATMLDLFFLYGLFGYVGLLFFLRTAWSLTGSYYPQVRRWVYVLALAPGLSFWSAAIGKDAPVFMAVQMALYGACRPDRRWAYILGGFAVIFVIRPHNAAILALAAILAVLLAQRADPRTRIVAVVAGAAAIALAVPFAMQYLNVDSLDQESINGYIFARANGLETGGSAVEIQNYPLPLKLFTYLYRPTLLEVNSGATFVAALENAFLMGVTVLLGVRVLRNPGFIRREPGLLFAVLFFMAGATAGALLTANLGMAEREKEQFVPCLFILFIAFLARGKAMAQQRATSRAARALAGQRIGVPVATQAGPLAT